MLKDKWQAEGEQVSLRQNCCPEAVRRMNNYRAAQTPHERNRPGVACDQAGAR
jgi:hypothetical protein